MALLAGLCLLGGLFGGVMVSTIQPLLQMLAGAPFPGAGTGPTPFSLVAFDAARSIYDAPTIALFLLISGTLTALLVHRISSRRTRLGPAWDCGFPEPSPLTQYSASSFSQPLRRVYGMTVFGASEIIDMPQPGDSRPARLTVRIHDYVWELLYAAPAAAVLSLSERLNTLQFLTIRNYLMLVFSALIVLLLIAAVWF
jgi:hydrogenase-4 component B